MTLSNADNLYRLLPAIHRIRDAELAESLRNPLTSEEASELAALEALPGPNATQQQRINALREKASHFRGLLTTAEVNELAALEALPNPNPSEQQRLAELHEKAARGPLKALLMAFADEFAVIEENLAQLYDDLFIETCAEWAIPYIGDLIGYEPLHALGQAKGLARAEVAHTIALRRRKGTASVLEQLARDVTGWNARAVEEFQLLAATQHMNHRRTHCLYAPDLRRWEPLTRIGGAFDSVAHTVDVRNIETGKGRFNIPNIGIFLWRVNAYRHSKSPAAKVDNRRYLVSPLGHPLQLYANPLAEDEITHLADPINVPDPIGRRLLAERKELYYGTRETPSEPLDNADPSIVLYVDDAEVPRQNVVVCHLGDDGLGWAHVPPLGKYAIDPELGRVAVASDLPAPGSVALTYHYGFTADLGGGEYSRPREADASDVKVLQVPNDFPTIQAALTALAGAVKGVVEITDSGRYVETPSVNVPPGGEWTIRAAEQTWPSVILGGNMTVRGGKDSAFALEGVRVAGGSLRLPSVTNQLARLAIRHATLTPGLALDAIGNPTSPGVASLSVELTGVAVSLEWSILGAVRVIEGSRLVANDCIIDSNAPVNTAYAAMDGVSSGGTLALEACTLIGKIRASAIDPGLNISNSLILALASPGDTAPPVVVARRQSGCVRFSFLPYASLVPRRYRCQPETAAAEADVTPRFTSLLYGVPSYCQLTRATPDAIRRGASDESEMGAFHALFPAQRETNLQLRLAEFLRVGLQAGIFYES